MAAGLLFVLLTGCETVPPDEPEFAASPRTVAVASAPLQPIRRGVRVPKARVQMQTLTAIRAANPQQAPAVSPRPRAIAPVIPRPRVVATEAADNPVARRSGIAFEWPVEGRVIAHFGRGGGSRNDGINIAAEPGTPIHAAAGGTVIFADKLKGYGKLILIRHDNRYITAYAHAQGILVTQGDHVTRGDVIGYSGATGDVGAPQLHFEIRQGVKPVDPKPLLMAARES